MKTIMGPYVGEVVGLEHVILWIKGLELDKVIFAVG